MSPAGNLPSMMENPHPTDRESAERAPYPLRHANDCNGLETLERDAGNLERAISAATHAYRPARCDGPPFANHWGLVAAQKYLAGPGAPEPQMSSLDRSKFEPMSEVEIDPEDVHGSARTAD